MLSIKSIFLGLILSIPVVANSQVLMPNPPKISSESYMLVDFKTKKVLLAKNENKMLSPASVTKLMTVYVVLKEITSTPMTQDDSVKISKNAVLTAKTTKSSRTFLEIGDEVSIKDLLKGLIVQSGNDAAIALAEYIAGTEDNFSDLMTAYAKKIGMENSKFRNASGLPKKDHYTTAKDLTILMSKLIEDFPDEYEYYFGMRSFEYNEIEQKSRNKLLFSYDDLFGGKTGWHTSALYCFTGSVEREGRRLIVATMKAPDSKDRFDDVVALSNYGYRYFENHTIVLKDKPIDGIETLPVYMSSIENIGIVPEDTITLTMRKGEYEKLTANINLDNKVIAPSEKGTHVGEIEILMGNEVLAKSNLITVDKVEQGSWFDVAKDKISILFFDE